MKYAIEGSGEPKSKVNMQGVLLLRSFGIRPQKLAAEL